jgi:glycosyltransferase involved in cell wall biosynthesis
MRVLALTPSFFGPTGDAVNERQLLMALAKKVEKCYIVTFVGSKHIFTKRRTDLKVALPKNITLILLPLPYVHVLMVYLIQTSISCLMSIIGLMLNALKKIDLVYIRNPFLSMGFLTFQSLAKKTVVKIPGIIEDEIPNRSITKFLIGKFVPFMDRLVLAKAKKVAVNGRPLYDELVRRRSFKHKDEPLEIPPGVDLSLIEKVKRQMDKKSPRNGKYVGYLGSFSWWQGVEILVQAVALLKEEVPNIKLFLIGDGELRPLIEKTCRTSNILYEITGFLPHEEALRNLAMLDVLVLPSKRMTTRESIIPIKVIEAWALGIPVIVTKHYVYLVDKIKDFEDVIFCEPEPRNVANALLTILTNLNLKKKLQKNGPKIALRFNYDKIAEKILYGEAPSVRPSSLRFITYAKTGKS